MTKADFSREIIKKLYKENKSLVFEGYPNGGFQNRALVKSQSTPENPLKMEKF